VWNADGSGEPIVLTGHFADVVDAEWSPDGKRIVTASYDGVARIFIVDLPELRNWISHSSNALLSPDQRMRLLGETAKDAAANYERQLQARELRRQ
jgi:WD40 repeat protein